MMDKAAKIEPELSLGQYLMFSIDKADSWRQVDGRRIERVDVSAALNGLAGYL